MKVQRTHEEISALCMELALFLRSGMDAASGLSLLAQEEADQGWKSLLAEMADRLRNRNT